MTGEQLEQAMLLGDCLVHLAAMETASVDSIVTDPPYEIGFMGKGWDSTGIAYNVELWRQCLRVLKPGGHLLAFGSTRTYHRMTVAIEDAGFEIRDSIHWVYGSGFPKSLDVSKAIDKQRDDRADIEKVVRWMEATRQASGVSRQQVEDAFGTVNIGQAFFTITPGSVPRVPTLDQVPTLLDVLGVNADDVPEDIRRLLWDLNGKKGQPGENWAKREVVGKVDATVLAVAPGEGRDRSAVELDITAPATDAARQWEGWGTALKPAHEPIVVARKPLVGTVAANVLEHGTGALNIDGCRVGSDGGCAVASSQMHTKSEPTAISGYEGASPRAPGLGRWPANLVFTHAADCADTCVDGCPVAALNKQSGEGVSRAGGRSTGADNSTWDKQDKGMFEAGQDIPRTGHNDSGGASRFFTVTEWDDPFLYVAKPGKKERNAGGHNIHPTVKPLALMRHLVRLVTPPGGTVLDPFLGSGTTAVAAVLEGFCWIGCELSHDYLPIIEGRVRWAHQQPASNKPKTARQPKTKQTGQTLFEDNAA